MKQKEMKQIIIPPKSGWKKWSWYLVEVSYNRDNPVFHDLFYTGFLEKGKPLGYNHFAGDTEGEVTTLNDIYYLKAVRLLVGEKELEKRCSRFMPDLDTPLNESK
jgi:hypothetical protein